MTRPPLPPPPPPPPLPPPIRELPASTFHKFKIENREVKTTVISAESDLTSHLSDFLSFISSDRQIKRIVGLDIETSYTSPDPSSSAVIGKVAVLKLCAGRRCLLIQLLHLKSVPSSLACFLDLPDLSFVGVGINRCLAALERDYGFGCRNAVDLVQLAATVKQKPYITAFGLVDLANEVGILNVRVKESKAALSDWGTSTLSLDQSPMKKNQFDYPLPEELIEEILLKVPFESILTCKLVSKQWKNLINDPKFYNRYDNRSVLLFSGDHKVLYCLITKHGIEFTNDQFPPFTIRHIPMKSKTDFYDAFMLSGSSNRIACVTGRESRKFLFCNLFTGTSYSVEKAPMPKGKIRGSSLYGFSYDSHEDDYKIFTRYEEDNGKFWIYSFKKQGWKSFNGFPSFYSVWKPKACSFNGVLHWLAIGEKLAVITYDAHSGNFGEILLPIAPSDYSSCGVRLCELDGKLCFLQHMDDCWLTYVWVQESWKKLLHIDLTEDSFLWDELYHATPTLLCQRKDGGKVVLFTRDGCRGLFWYDLDSNDYYKFYL